MWDADDANVDDHATPSHLPTSSRFSLDDAFSDDDGVLNATLEFNPATIRAALARTLAAGNGDNGGGHDVGASDLDSNHNGAVGVVEDPDASVSTLDINAPSGYGPARAPGEWSRSTNSSHEYGYRQDSKDTASGVESLANFSTISLSDSVHDLESVEISLEPSEERVGDNEDTPREEVDDDLFRAVHIDLSQGGKPRVEELTAILPGSPKLHIPDRGEVRTPPSPKPPPPPPLPSTFNESHSTNVPPPTPPAVSDVYKDHQSESRFASELSI